MVSSIAANNISSITSTDLCCSCGACAGICHQDAIKIEETIDGRFIPTVTEDCIGCGKCLQICPGINIHDFEHYIGSMDDPFKGNFISAHIGKATNPLIYSEAQNGGLVTAIISSLFEKDKIQGAVVTRQNPQNPRENQMVIVTKPEDLLEAQKSKYTQSTALKVLSSIRDFDGELAFVGLPCHMHALHNLKKADPNLASKVKYRLGLVCDRLQTNLAFDFFAIKAGVNLQNIKSITFRDKTTPRGYPGDVSIIGKNGLKKIIPFEFRMAIKECFTPLRCRLCFDKMNIFSDLVSGDPHGILDCDRSGGESVCIVRTSTGKEMLDIASDLNQIAMRDIEAERIFDGQKILDRCKQWRRYTDLFSETKRKIPEYSQFLVNKSLPTSPAENLACDKLLKLSIDVQNIKNPNEFLYSLIVENEKISIDSHYILNKPKIVEIIGTNFTNKGAMLMLLASIDKIRKRMGNDVKIVAPTCSKVGKFLLYDIIPSIPGIVTLKDLDLVLDASGFTYSDQFYPGVTAMRANHYRQYKENGVKVILLPQAFGPFQNPKHRIEFSQLTECCDLIFAREKTSFNHITDAAGKKSNVRIAPDFTNLLEATIPENAIQYKNKVAIIPNMRMVEFAKTQDEITQYVIFTQNCFTLAEKYGFQPFFLIHEGAVDIILAHRINNTFKKPYEIVIEEDPLLLKGIIGSCAMVV